MMDNQSSERISPLDVMYVEHNAMWGGSVFSLHDLVSHLSDEIRPIVCQFCNTEFEEFFEHAGVQVARVPYKVFGYRKRGSVLRKSRLGRTVLSLQKWTTYTVPLVRFFYTLFRTYRPTLIHLNDNLHQNRSEILAAAMAGIPCVCHLRSIHSQFNPFELWVSQSVSRFIATSEVVKENAVQAGLCRARIKVIYNGIDFPFSLPSSTEKTAVRNKLGLDLGKEYVLSLGRLVPWKGVDRLISIWPDVVSARPGVCLLIVGDGTEGQRLKRLAEATGVAETIQFVGFVHDVWDYLLASDIYVHSAVLPEPFGRSLVEAMGAGLAIVAPDSGAVRELLEPGISGRLYNPRDVAGLREVLVQLLCNTALRYQLGHTAAVQARSRFGVQKYAQAVQQIYLDVLGRDCQNKSESTCVANEHLA